jgi:hypothetical protein
MKTVRENEIATGLMQAGKMVHRAGLNCHPEAEYGVDGRRCDVRFDTPDAKMFLEIFAGKSLSYMRDRLLMRDSRIFNRRLGKKNLQTMHLICNDDAFRAFTVSPMSDVEHRLVSVGEELDHYATHSVRVLPTHPTKIQFREIANEILGTLGF